MSDIVQKQCAYCKQSYPATLQFFYKHKQHPDGLQSRCKACFNKDRKPRPILPEGYKRCSGCKQPFPLTSEYFYRAVSRHDGFAANCKPCSDKKFKARYQDRKENGPKESIPLFRVCSDCAVSLPSTSEYFRKSPTSPHGLAARCRNCECIFNRRYKQSPQSKENQVRIRRTIPGRSRMIATLENRRARKLGIPGKGITAQEIEQQYHTQKGKCGYCLVKLGATFELDHVVPITRGGTHESSNAVLACRPCNRSKGDKLLHEWPQGGRLI